MSGSRIRTSYDSTDPIINSAANRQNIIAALTKTYDKSVQVDTRYSAMQDETLVLPINQPFLLEKAIIEFPIEAGTGWFNDKTKCFIPLTEESPFSYNELTSAFDVGGPGLTVALYNQIPIGQNKTKRDLILSGTITHQFDNTAELTFSNYPDLSPSPGEWGGSGGQVWQLTPQGFKAYGTPNVIINAEGTVGNYFYTGSVRLKCAAEISNGILIRDTIVINQAYLDSSNINYVYGNLDALFSSSLLRIPRETYNIYTPGPSMPSGEEGSRISGIMSVNNFSRGATGFEPSGRSIFGKEYTTSQDKSEFFQNPFYLYQGQDTLASLKNSISVSGAGSVVMASQIIQQGKTSVSPYLLFPGDKLVLSVSKSRPVFFSTLTSSPWTSGSIQHDIKLTTGSINITLYGSLVSNGKEFHDTLNQPLSSDAIHEVVIGGTNT
jgi:hypothetical protein